MRVLVLTQYFFPHPGGSQEYIAQLYEHLCSKYPDVAVDLICYNTDNANSYEKYGSINVYRVGCWEILRGQFAIPNFIQLINLVHTLKKKYNHYDIVNSHTRFFDNSWWAPTIAKYFSAKSILTDHCASHPVHGTGLIGVLANAIDWVIVRTIPHFYDSVVVISKATGRFLEQHGYTKKYLVMYAGVHKDFLNPTQQEIKKIEKLTKGFSVVTFLGRMIPTKSPQVCLEAAQEITRANKKILFIFAGDGSEYENLKKFQTQQIVFLGKITKATAAALLHTTNILIHPSRHHEGLPITLLEAGVSGCTVVASPAGGSQEVIIHNKTGKIVTTDAQSLKKIVEKLLKNPSEQKKLARSLKQKVEKEFNWNLTVEQYYSLLTSLA